MAVTDAILQSYVDAPTLLAAEAELDRLSGRGDELPVPIGGLYDELAEAAANDDDYEMAARLETKALEAGCPERLLAREMRGWYLLKAGETEEGEAAFRELLIERPDDAEARITLGHARSDAGFQDAALEAFDDALAAAKRRGYRKEIDRARVERRAEREDVGLELDEDDRLAPAPRPPRSGATAWAVAWFPPDQHSSALEHWPDLGQDLTDPARYAEHIEKQLRTLHGALGHRPTVAPLIVDDFLAWAGEEGYDPARGDARSSTPQSSTGLAEQFRGRRVATTRAGACRVASTSAAAAAADRRSGMSAGLRDRPPHIHAQYGGVEGVIAISDSGVSAARYVIERSTRARTAGVAPRGSRASSRTSISLPCSNEAACSLRSATTARCSSRSASNPESGTVEWPGEIDRDPDVLSGSDERADDRPLERRTVEAAR